jgi:hypothetical protein
MMGLPGTTPEARLTPLSKRSDTGVRSSHG